MKKLNVFVFTTFNKNDSNMYLKKINANSEIYMKLELKIEKNY